MISRREYIDESGHNRFRRWLDDLDDAALARVLVSLERLSDGNLSQIKGVGAGVSELKINFGPGYRVYFGWDGDVLIILLGGGTKARQQKDIVQAQQDWIAYKRRRRSGV
jgi:putative addiction module killer protein